MRCSLGGRKLLKIEKLTGRKVKAAVVRGGWSHYWALVSFADGSKFWVNYKTGTQEEYDPAAFSVSPARHEVVINVNMEDLLSGSFSVADLLKVRD